MSQYGKQSLRIALLTPFITPFTAAGGISELYKTLAEGLGEAGHDVTVIGVNLHSVPRSVHAWGSLISLPSPKRSKLISRAMLEAFAVARYVRRNARLFDVVECSSWPGLSALLMNSRLPSVVRLITSITVDSHVGRKELAINYLLEWLAVRRATLVFASTDYILKKSRDLYRLRLLRVSKVSLAVADVAPLKVDRPPNAVVRFLVIAAATKRKGTDILMRALALAVDQRDGFEIELVGPTWAPYDEFATNRGELAIVWKTVRSKLGDRIKLMYDISDEEKLALFNNADYLIMTSRSESFGLPVIEAMRSGVAVISSRGGALSEVSGASDQNLFYGDPEDYEALARVLVEAVDAGPSDAMRRRTESRQTYERFYSTAMFIEKSVAGYRQAIEMKAR